jgi:hypothetical protein
MDFSPFLDLLFPVILVASACAACGSWMAIRKGRDQVEGGALGALFGPVGLLIEASLPPIKDSKSSGPQSKGIDRVA